MSVPSETAVKTLFAESRNLCFFTRCEERLTDPSWRQVNADIAHIKGERPGSARYDKDQPEPDRQSYGNLMLLCPKHHRLVDRLDPDAYSVETLLEMKRRHIEHQAGRQWIAEDEAARVARLAVEEYARMYGGRSSDLYARASGSAISSGRVIEREVTDDVAVTDLANVLQTETGEPLLTEDGEPIEI